MTDASGGTLGDSSLLLEKTQTPLNMDDAQDVVLLLKRIHQGPIDPDTKNHLRDLIFSYRQTPEANTLRLLKDACEKLGVIIASSEKKEQKMDQNKEPNKTGQVQLGVRRPAPVFAASSADAAAIIPQKPSPAVDQVLSQPRPVTSEVPNYSKPVSTVIGVSHEEPNEKNVAQPSAVMDEAPTQAQPFPPQPAAYHDPNDRINEIKRSVNEHVGNPINLIEADNAVGKEYMQALLDAMKKRNSGMPHEIAAAMDRLEKAYAAVDALIAGGGLERAKDAHAHNTTIKQEPLEAATETSTPLRVPVRIEKTPKTMPTHTDLQPLMENAEINAPIAHAHTTPSVIPNPEPTIIQQKSVSIDAAYAKPRSVDVDKSSVSTSGMHSVAKEKQLQDLMRATHMKEAEAAKEQEATRVAAMDPLMTPEVDAGLGQLLSEWSLFKSSGFFGTGPGGKEHALYRKLAGLPMAAVVAGRFEGATPKIRQSITDYMNGWRYEDGIIYDPAETFERYLRKVIRHILDRQKSNA